MRESSGCPSCAKQTLCCTLDDTPTPSPLRRVTLPSPNPRKHQSPQRHARGAAGIKTPPSPAAFHSQPDAQPLFVPYESPPDKRASSPPGRRSPRSSRASYPPTPPRRSCPSSDPGSPPCPA
ncbi:hypothetical protein DIPPA_12392 [Diplonema papillatum]|nr:hypothetical protein DIPPA_12392 [Diplonema papillatum]